jgi:predicted esterase
MASTSLPPEVIKITALNATTGLEESAYCFTGDDDVINRVTNDLIFGDATRRATRPGGAGAAKPGIDEKALSALTSKHSLTSAYSPSSSPITTNLLVFLPGSGETTPSNNFLSLGKSLDLPQTGVLSLLGCHELPFDLGYGWYQEMDYETGSQLSGSDNRRRNTLQAAVNTMKSFLTDLNEIIALENVFIFSFSSGSTVAMSLSQTMPLLGGAVCVCGGIPEHASATSGRPAPVLQIVGEKDELFPPESAKACAKKYGDSHVEMLVVKGKRHGMINSKEETLAFHTWIAPRLARRMPKIEAQCT